MKSIHFQRIIVVAWLALVFCINANGQKKRILMFVAAEQTYYSEFIVMQKALLASGYTVDIRSSGVDSAGLYFHHYNNNLRLAADNLTGSNYQQFVAQFVENFSVPWDSTWNFMPPKLKTMGRIQDVNTMDDYDAMVLVGGTGAIAYRIDGSYESQGKVSRVDVKNAALKLNKLAVEALRLGKPVLAQCHSSSVPVFWRVPSTEKQGSDGLGISILKGSTATGFPDKDTPEILRKYDVVYNINDRVTVTSPTPAIKDNGSGKYKLITTRDWYPQTVACAARTLLNILESYPTKQQMDTQVKVLILHGGPIDVSNCSARNRNNDVPCNYGTDPKELPADYRDIQELFLSKSPVDNYKINVSELNITKDRLPYDPLNKSSILNYLSIFNVVVFYKHWSTGVTNELQSAIIDFADNGGGVLALHHGLYNSIDGELNKQLLVNNLFGAESSTSDWSANRTNYNLIITNQGHFVSTYGLNLSSNYTTPGAWLQNPMPIVANSTYSYFSGFSVFDELYNNMTFIKGQRWGRNIGEITPILSNDVPVNSSPLIAHTSGFIKLFNPSGDKSIGRVAFYEPGERKENLSTSHPYGQIIRNTLIWLSSSEFRK